MPSLPSPTTLIACVLASVALASSAGARPRGQAPASPAAALPSAADVERGRMLFTRHTCAFCHGTNGQGLSVTGARIGPPSRSLENFVRYVRRPGGAMPAMGEQVVPEADLADVYAFLRTMPAPKPAAEVPLLRQLKSPGR